MIEKTLKRDTSIHKSLARSLLYAHQFLHVAYLYCSTVYAI